MRGKSPGLRKSPIWYSNKQGNPLTAYVFENCSTSWSSLAHFLLCSLSIPAICVEEIKKSPTIKAELPHMKPFTILSRSTSHPDQLSSQWLTQFKRQHLVMVWWSSLESRSLAGKEKANDLNWADLGRRSFWIGSVFCPRQVIKHPPCLLPFWVNCIRTTFQFAKSMFDPFLFRPGKWESDSFPDLSKWRILSHLSSHLVPCPVPDHSQVQFTKKSMNLPGPILTVVSFHCGILLF